MVNKLLNLAQIKIYEQFAVFIIHWNVNPEIIMFTDSFGIRWYSLLYGAAFF